MKVCFKNIRGNSGADIWMINLADALKKIGVETDVHFYDNRFQYFPYLLKSGNGNGGWDIIHSNTWNGFAFKEKNIPLVVTEHHVEHLPSHGKYKTLAQKAFHKLVYQYEKKSLRDADVVTCYSEYTQKQLKSVFGYDSKMIYAGVDTDKFRPMAAKDNFKEWDKNKIRLLFVGNMIKRKGFDLLARIMERLGDEFILLCTSGMRKNIIEKYADNFFIIGTISQDDIVNYYNMCDILLFPSRLEGFGIAVAEAMACAKPVVTTNCSSLPELVVDGKGGFLCEMDNVDEFAEKIIFLAKEPGLREKMGMYNRERVQKEFSLVEMARSYNELYKTALEIRRSGKNQCLL